MKFLYINVLFLIIFSSSFAQEFVITGKAYFNSAQKDEYISSIKGMKVGQIGSIYYSYTNEYGEYELIVDESKSQMLYFEHNNYNFRIVDFSENKLDTLFFNDINSLKLRAIDYHNTIIKIKGKVINYKNQNIESAQIQIANYYKGNIKTDNKGRFTINLEEDFINDKKFFQEEDSILYIRISKQDYFDRLVSIPLTQLKNKYDIGKIILSENNYDNYLNELIKKKRIFIENLDRLEKNEKALVATANNFLNYNEDRYAELLNRYNNILAENIKYKNFESTINYDLYLSGSYFFRTNEFQSKFPADLYIGLLVKDQLKLVFGLPKNFTYNKNLNNYVSIFKFEFLSKNFLNSEKGFIGGGIIYLTNFSQDPLISIDNQALNNDQIGLTFETGLKLNHNFQTGINLNLIWYDQKYNDAYNYNFLELYVSYKFTLYKKKYF